MGAVGSPGLPPVAAEGCSPIDEDVDYARIRPKPADYAIVVREAEKAHAEVRAKNGLPPESPPAPRIRVFTWGSFLPDRISIVAVANDRGEWDVVKAQEGREGGRLPAVAPTVTRYTIAGDAAARINRLAFDRCTFREPTYYDRVVPMRDGSQAACADGANSVVDIEVGGRRHRSYHACRNFGRAGAVADSLWQASTE